MGRLFSLGHIFFAGSARQRPARRPGGFHHPASVMLSRAAARYHRQSSTESMQRRMASPLPLQVMEIAGRPEGYSGRSPLHGLTSNRDQRLRIRARARPVLRALAAGRAFAAPRFAAFTWPRTFKACLTLALGADP
jgi:hypothetical protein